MLLAELFAPHDAAVMITGIVGAIVAILKFVPQRGHSDIKKGLHDLGEKFHKFQLELVEIKFKANQCWDYLFRSAARTVVAGGFGTTNSPLSINPEVMNWFAPMKHQLQEWYSCQTVDPNAPNERDLLINLDHVFGAKILEAISLPHNRPYPACLIVAFAVARGERVVDLPCLSPPENNDPPPQLT